MMKEKLRKWFQSLDQENQVLQIKKKAMDVAKSFAKLQKALDDELHAGDNGIQRTGARGGKFTSLVAASERANTSYNSDLEMLKLMTSLI